MLSSSSSADGGRGGELGASFIVASLGNFSTRVTGRSLGRFGAGLTRSVCVAGSPKVISSSDSLESSSSKEALLGVAKVVTESHTGGTSAWCYCHVGRLQLKEEEEGEYEKCNPSQPRRKRDRGGREGQRLKDTETDQLVNYLHLCGKKKS